MNVPQNLRYSKDHEWVRPEGNTWRVGITDFAQHELGDVVFCELPPPGRELRQGEAFAVVESVKAASDVYSPISGKVVRANDKLASSPELINSLPYEDGWLIEIAPAEASGKDALMDAETYSKLIAE